MKECPTCKESYGDEHNYCEIDGTALDGKAKKKSSKKFFFAVTLIVVLLFFLTILNGLPYIAKLMASNCKVTLTGVSVVGDKITLLLTVKNDNPVSVDLEAVEFTFFVNSNQIGTGKLDKDKKVSLRAKKSTEIQAPLDVSALGLFTAAADLVLSNESTYHIKGEVIVKTFFGSVAYPLNIQGAEIPI